MIEKSCSFNPMRETDKNVSFFVFYEDEKECTE